MPQFWGMALTVKERLFVQCYLKHKNATRAAREAGYSKASSNTIGPRLLVKDCIKEAIKAGLAKQAAKLEISAENVIKEIAKIAFQKLSKRELKNISGHKLRALEHLGRHFNLFTDNLQVTGKDGGPQVHLHTFENGSESDNGESLTTAHKGDK